MHQSAMEWYMYPDCDLPKSLMFIKCGLYHQNITSVFQHFYRKESHCMDQKSWLYINCILYLAFRRQIYYVPCFARLFLAWFCTTNRIEYLLFQKILVLQEQELLHYKWQQNVRYTVNVKLKAQLILPRIEKWSQLNEIKLLFIEKN